MKTIYALFKGSEILDKSERRNDLIPGRDKTPGSYISPWLGHPDIKLSDDPLQPLYESIEEKTGIINTFDFKTNELKNKLLEVKN